MKRLLAIGAVTIALTACAMPAAYAPARSPTAHGFSEQRLERDRWRVSFQGTGADSEARVADLALLRVADLTLQNGFDWFRVEARYADARGGGVPRSSVSIGGGTGSFGRSGYGGVGVGIGLPLGSGGPAIRESLEVRLGGGPPPPDRDVYDARAVQASIGSRLKR